MDENIKNEELKAESQDLVFDTGSENNTTIDTNGADINIDTGNSEPQETKKNPLSKLGKKPKGPKTKKGKKKWIIIGVIVLIIIIRSLGSGDSSYDTSEEYDWPSVEVAQMLPEPEGTITSLDYDDSSLSADVELDDAEDCKAYIDECKAMGYTKDADYYFDDGDYDYEAYNEDGWSIWVYNYDEEMCISLYAPDDYDADIDEEEDGDDDDDSSSSSSSSTVSADFRSTMDDYEAFMDNYIAFMQKYNKSSNPSSMLADYSDMMTKYASFASKIDSIDTDKLSDADYAYYIEVTTRVTGKLAKASL